MKTKFNIVTVILSVVLALGLSNCTNPEVDMQDEFNIKLRPSTILSGFTPYRQYHFEMYKNSHLRITCLLYDGSGNLAYSNQALLDGYDKDITFSIKLSPGSYKLIALATNIIGSLSSPSEEAYLITGKESLSQLQIVQTKIDESSTYSFNSAWNIMGYASKTLDFSSREIVVNLEPATELVYLEWRDIHSHDPSSEIYGQYTATATDYWGATTYTWPISIEKDGDSSTDVIVKNLSPILYEDGKTADEGCNTYKGKISGDVLTIPHGQSTGCSSERGEILLEGGAIDGEYITFEDVVLQIGDGKLTTANMFGTCVPGSDGGWYDLFNPGVIFSKPSSKGIDTYVIIYHHNNVMKFSESGTPQFSSSLSTVENGGDSISPADYPDAVNIISLHNLFPGRFEMYARTTVGNDWEDYPRKSVSLSAGHQYVFSLDCYSMDLTSYEGTLGTKSQGLEFVPSVSKIALPVVYPDIKHEKLNW